MSHLATISAALDVMYGGPGSGHHVPFPEPDWRAFMLALSALEGVQHVTIHPKDLASTDPNSRTFLVTLTVDAVAFTTPYIFGTPTEYPGDPMDTLNFLYRDEGNGVDEHLMEVLATTGGFWPHWTVRAGGHQHIRALSAGGQA